jgi:hypothetical protein
MPPIQMFNNQLIKNNHLSFQELPIAVNARFYYCLELNIGGPHKKAACIEILDTGKYFHFSTSKWKIFSKGEIIVEKVCYFSLFRQF